MQLTLCIVRYRVSRLKAKEGNINLLIDIPEPLEIVIQSEICNLTSLHYAEPHRVKSNQILQLINLTTSFVILRNFSRSVVSF